MDVKVTETSTAVYICADREGEINPALQVEVDKETGRVRVVGCVDLEVVQSDVRLISCMANLIQCVFWSSAGHQLEEPFKRSRAVSDEGGSGEGIMNDPTMTPTRIGLSPLRDRLEEVREERARRNGTMSDEEELFQVSGDVDRILEALLSWLPPDEEKE